MTPLGPSARYGAYLSRRWLVTFPFWAGNNVPALVASEFEVQIAMVASQFEVQIALVASADVSYTLESEFEVQIVI